MLVLVLLAIKPDQITSQISFARFTRAKILKTQDNELTHGLDMLMSRGTFYRFVTLKGGLHNLGKRSEYSQQEKVMKVTTPRR